MRIQIALYTLSLLAASGCGQTAEPAPPPTHPANPLAAEASSPPPSATLRSAAATAPVHGPSTAPTGDPSAGHESREGHENHGAHGGHAK